MLCILHLQLLNAALCDFYAQRCYVPVTCPVDVPLGQMNALLEWCHDEHPSCAGYAAQGECVRNPEWMIAHCAAACNTCKTRFLPQAREGRHCDAVTTVTAVTAVTGIAAAAAVTAVTAIAAIAAIAAVTTVTAVTALLAADSRAVATCGSRRHAVPRDCARVGAREQPATLPAAEPAARRARLRLPGSVLPSGGARAVRHAAAWRALARGRRCGREWAVEWERGRAAAAEDCRGAAAGAASSARGGLPLRR